MQQTPETSDAPSREAFTDAQSPALTQFNVYFPGSPRDSGIDTSIVAFIASTNAKIIASATNIDTMMRDMTIACDPLHIESIKAGLAALAPGKITFEPPVQKWDDKTEPADAEDILRGQKPFEDGTFKVRAATDEEVRTAERRAAVIRGVLIEMTRGDMTETNTTMMAVLADYVCNGIVANERREVWAHISAVMELNIEESLRFEANKAAEKAARDMMDRVREGQKND
jgi:hypothetical protein